MNKAILMGRLTKDPEVRYTTNNIPVCRMSIAIDRTYSKQGEERKTDFFDITAWRNTAEFCGKYFRKGLRILVEGRIQNRVWDDNNGVRRYSTEIVADNVFFADGKKTDSSFNTSTKVDNNSNTGEEDGFYKLNEEDDELPF